MINSFIAIIIIVYIINTILGYKKYNWNYQVELNSKALREKGSYYINSESLFLSNVEYDENGIIFHRYAGVLKKIGNQYNPAYIAWLGLININKYLLDQEGKYLLTAIKYSQWLVDNINVNQCAWTYNFDKYEGSTFLQAPWKSAMAQGLAISLLVRVAKITNRNDFLCVANKALDVFEKTILDGGVVTHKNGYVFFEEYPAYPNSFVLDGFCFSLLGVYDLWKYTGNKKSLLLFRQGIESLENNIQCWNFKNKWTWYGTHGYLCNSMYNKLNSCLVEVLGELSDNVKLSSIGKGWNPKNLRQIDKIEIFILSKVFLAITIIRIVILKNIKRIKKYVWNSRNNF